MYNTVILVLHVLISVILIMLIILQIGKGANLSNLFGGGTSDAIFSGAGGDMFLKKLTIGFASAFLLTSLGLTVFSSRRMVRSVVQEPVPVSGVNVGQEEGSGSQEQSESLPGPAAK